MKEKLEQLKRTLNPYYDIILFVICLFAANYFWKYTVLGEDARDATVMFFGLDITAPFSFMAEHIAKVAYWSTSLVRPTIHYLPPYTMWFGPKEDPTFMVSIVWGCTAIKQSFIWLIIMLFARGDWKRKLWFIPFGWLCIYLFNIVRIILIGILCEHHPEMFVLWHEYVFKYLFYGMLFMLWVWWVERLGNVKKKEVEDE